jgi:DUF1680 family protein
MNFSSPSLIFAPLNCLLALTVVLMTSCQPPRQGLRSIPLADIQLAEGFWQKQGLSFEESFSFTNDSTFSSPQDQLLAIQGEASQLPRFYAQFWRKPSTGPIDWLERSLYNAVLVQAQRENQPLPHPGHFMLVAFSDTLLVNLYLNARIETEISGRQVAFRVETDYPGAANIKLSWEKAPAQPIALALRLPGWAMNQPVPDSSYVYFHYSNRKLALKVNGELTHPDLWQGYAVIKKIWQAGEMVRLSLPMSVRRVRTDRADSLQNRLSVEYGPLVYVAQEGTSHKLALSGTKQYFTEEQETPQGIWQKISGTGWEEEAEVPISLVPYWVGSQKNPTKPQIWFFQREEQHE